MNDTDSDKEDKKWAIEQLALIMDMLVDELRAYGESLASSSEYVSGSIDSTRNQILTGIGFLVTLAVGLASIGRLNSDLAEEFALVLIAIALGVYLIINFLRDAAVRLIESIGLAYDTGADRMDFFRGQFYSASIHLDKIPLTSVYACESFIKVLLGEVAGTIRASFLPLLQFSPKPSSLAILRTNIESLDQLIEIGYQIYVTNKSVFQDARSLLGPSLDGAEQFSMWHDDEYSKMKKLTLSKG